MPLARRLLPSLAAALLAATPAAAQEPAAAARPAAEELSDEQRRAVGAGQHVLVTRAVAGSGWPAVRVYLYIDATPEEAAAVFADYARHASYIPKLKRSRISRVLDPATTEVDYTLEVPFFPDEDYTVRDRVSADGAGGYRVEWTLVRASSTQAIEGSARFEPWANARLGRSGTLLAYSNFVRPGSRLAGVGAVRTRAVRQVADAARAIARQVEGERARDGALLRRQVETLRAAVGEGRER